MRHDKTSSIEFINNLIEVAASLNIPRNDRLRVFFVFLQNDLDGSIDGSIDASKIVINYVK